MSLMKKRYFMGNDVAKARFDLSLFCSNGSRLWKGHFSNSSTGIEEYLSQLQARPFKLKQIHFGLEASGVYGKALVGALLLAGLALSVLIPSHVKLFALSVLRLT